MSDSPAKQPMKPWQSVALLIASLAVIALMAWGLR